MELPDTIKATKEALPETIEASDKAVSLPFKIIRGLLVKPEKWAMKKDYDMKIFQMEQEYRLKETAILLEEKLKNIHPDKIVEPEMYIAIPTLQAISYSMDSEELREMYALLLSKAMNTTCPATKSARQRTTL